MLQVVVVVVTTTVLVLRPNKAKLVSQWRTKPKWRSLGEPFYPAEFVCSEERWVVLFYPCISMVMVGVLVAHTTSLFSHYLVINWKIKAMDFYK